MLSSTSLCLQPCLHCNAIYHFTSRHVIEQDPYLFSKSLPVAFLIFPSRTNTHFLETREFNVFILAKKQAHCSEQEYQSNTFLSVETLSFFNVYHLILIQLKRMFIPIRMANKLIHRLVDHKEQEFHSLQNRFSCLIKIQRWNKALNHDTFKTGFHV